jgi:hypothetical protein
MPEPNIIIAPIYGVGRTASAYPPESLDPIDSAWHTQKVDLCRISTTISEVLTGDLGAVLVRR